MIALAHTSRKIKKDSILLYFGSFNYSNPVRPYTELFVELILLCSLLVGHNPTRLLFSNEALMLINRIKRPFIVRVSGKNENPFQYDQYSLIYRTSLLSY